MSTIDSYGVVGDGVRHNNNNSGRQSSPASGGSVGLMPNMRLAFGADGTAVYKPFMPPTSSHSASATAAPSYQTGGNESPSAAAAPPGMNSGAGQQTKRKRGRPRKYSLDGPMVPMLTSPFPPPPHPQPEGGLQSSGFSSPTTPASAPALLLPHSGKKPRGRPRGSGRKQNFAALGSAAGVGFTPHVITVKAGEDVSSKIMSFSQNGTKTICILSANGAISNVTLRQSATSGGTVTYEGRFEILSLSGSYMLSESGGQRSRTGGLSVLLSGPDGRVLGGGVAGLLTAATPVQVVVGCFIPRQELKSPNQADLSTAPAKFVSGAPAAGSPGSRGTPSESSGGPGSPLNQSTGAYNNSNPQGMATLPWQ
ncbi:hypothetical protein U1Q18_039942 [Sarracenia purpurea var. burkii]